MSWMRTVVIAYGFGSLALGCGGTLSHTVDSDDLKEMSRHGQVWVFDAENEIIVALDRLDEARDEYREVKYRLTRAETMLDHAKKRGGSAEQVAEQFIEYLNKRKEWANENIALHKQGLLVARAGVELAKAQVINREDLLGGKDFSLKEFQTQHAELKKAFDAAQKEVDQLAKAVRKSEQKWLSSRRNYTAQSGDYDSGLWIE